MKPLPQTLTAIVLTLVLLAPLAQARVSLLEPAPAAASVSGLQPRLRSSADQGQLAQIQYIYRGFSVQPPQQRLERARVKQPLFEQYFLRSGAAEKASIRFRDGTTLHINQRTDAVLTSPNVTMVRRGEVAEYLAPGTNHRVQTAAAVAAAIGTTYDVRVNGGTTTFVVLHGALQIANGSGSVVVTSNHQTVVTANRAPAQPSPVDARAVFAWTSGIPTPDLGEDVTLNANGGAIVAYSSQREGPGDRGHVQHINDGLLSEGWETAAGKTTNEFVKIGFLGGNFYRISDVIIDPAATYGDPSSEDLKDFEIRVSSTGTDDGSFTTVFHGTCREQDELQRFTLPVPVRARYVELVALDNYGSPQRLAVAEWEVVANTSLFGQPAGIAVDRQGNIYVADTNSNRIQKLSPGGTVLARWGKKGDHPGEFLRPQGLAIDRQGNVYVADTFNHRIQKLSPSGRFLKQWGSPGIKAGQFLFPHDVAVDGQGNIYVTDVANRIQKLSRGGSVLAVWSDLGSTGALSFPQGITLDRHGNILVADSGNHRIVALSSSGTPIATFGSEGSGPKQFEQPAGVAVDAQNTIYVTDTFNDRIQKIDAKGKVSVWGKGGSGRGQFILPAGVAVDTRGNVYIADQGNSRVQKLSSGGKLRAIWGKYATVPQVLGEPQGIAVDTRGHVFLTDALNDRVQQRSLTGAVQAVYGHHGYVAPEQGKGLGQFWFPHGIAVDRQGAIYVADTFNNRIQILAPRGPIAALGKTGTGRGQFSTPLGVAVDAKGDIYVADSGNSRVQELSPRGTILRVFGTYGTGRGQFVFPTGIAIDGQGNVYVSDTCSVKHPETCNPSHLYGGRVSHLYGGRVQKFSSDGTLLDVWGEENSPAGTGRFFEPSGLTTDPQGNVYVADTHHDVVQKLSPTGQLLAVFDLPGPNANPTDVSLDSQGNLYVTDAANSRIVKLAPTGEVLDIWR